MTGGMRYEDRTDGVKEKMRLLQAAYGAGNFEIAMSLAESIKDTLSFEWQSAGDIEHAEIGAEQFQAVVDLPEPWARWASGWRYCKPLAVFETVGIARSREPVEVGVGFQAHQVVDVQRELRVARVDPRQGTLHEIPSQVYGEVRRGDELHCRVVFLADAPMHDRASYLIFYGNENAERPQYPSDLNVTGEGYALDIENHHYVARLSRQMGQLERLTYKRQHGLELYAGGKGHGEPPMIDWSHDYVDPGHFQKLRMRNWAQCPNYEVIQGPLVTRVRRWGFPHSPVHPLFAPSRVHMDQTYSFYAGSPVFFKEGRFDMVKDVEVAAMRDDEWVLSGYSFTDTIWIDRQGKLHEGPAPADGLWGVGFYHRTSRDAFVALWLEHAAENFAGIEHSGAPTLHYDGHGQLWSRYPANEARFKSGAALRQRNAYLVGSWPQNGAARQIEQLRHQLLNPLDVRAEMLPGISATTTKEPLARPGETEETAPLKPAIWRALREVRDEQLYKVDANVVDMGYVYDVQVRAGVVRVSVTMPHRGRPVHEFLATQGGGRVEEGVQERVLRIPGVQEVVVEPAWNPPWTVARLTDAGRRAMGLSG